MFYTEDIEFNRYVEMMPALFSVLVCSYSANTDKQNINISLLTLVRTCDECPQSTRKEKVDVNISLDVSKELMYYKVIN